MHACKYVYCCIYLLWEIGFVNVLISHLTANQLAELSDSPLDSDRTELLRVADPVDYSGHAAADFYFADSGNVEGLTTGRARSPASASRPQSLAVDRQWPPGRPAARPPRNIFDDIWTAVSLTAIFQVNRD